MLGPQASQRTQTRSRVVPDAPTPRRGPVPETAACRGRCVQPCARNSGLQVEYGACGPAPRCQAPALARTHDTPSVQRAGHVSGARPRRWRRRWWRWWRRAGPGNFSRRDVGFGVGAEAAIRHHVAQRAVALEVWVNHVRLVPCKRVAPWCAAVPVVQQACPAQRGRQTQGQCQGQGKGGAGGAGD